ncbi:hypothetical protein [Nitrospirillum amazonense]|uniref:hypothetical protein n=1 Tax=Nitrospirillum amazonense TaxID=28077 RepID=UPI0024126145|nr:hypothetical protein [Nitrospirillum amazonense]MDG3444567.1 hypothetical protein [Nitrospirillum amazonense]
MAAVLSAGLFAGIDVESFTLQNGPSVGAANQGFSASGNTQLEAMINQNGAEWGAQAESDFPGIRVLARIIPKAGIIEAGPLEELYPDVSPSESAGTCGISMPTPKQLREMVRGVQLYSGDRYGKLDYQVVVKVILEAIFSHEEWHCIDQAADLEESPAGPGGIPHGPFAEMEADAFMAIRYRQGRWPKPESDAVMAYIYALRVTDEAYGRLSHWTSPAIDAVLGLPQSQIPMSQEDAFRLAQRISVTAAPRLNDRLAMRVALCEVGVVWGTSRKGDLDKPPVSFVNLEGAPSELKREAERLKSLAVSDPHWGDDRQSFRRDQFARFVRSKCPAILAHRNVRLREWPDKQESANN